MPAADHSHAVSSDFLPVQGVTSGKVKSLQDYDSYPKQFVVRRLVVFVGIVIGYAQLLAMCCRVNCARDATCTVLSGMLGLCRYACYYLTRNSLTYTAPVMVSDPSLGMDITQVPVPVKSPCCCIPLGVAFPCCRQAWQDFRLQRRKLA